MNTKEFYSLIKELKKYESAPKTWKNKFRIWKTNRKINKLIHSAAKVHSQYAYDYMVKLYNEILTSNLEK